MNIINQTKEVVNYRNITSFSEFINNSEESSFIFNNDIFIPKLILNKCIILITNNNIVTIDQLECNENIIIKDSNLVIGKFIGKKVITIENSCVECHSLFTNNLSINNCKIIYNKKETFITLIDNIDSSIIISNSTLNINGKLIDQNLEQYDNILWSILLMQNNIIYWNPEYEEELIKLASNSINLNTNTIIISKIRSQKSIFNFEASSCNIQVNNCNVQLIDCKNCELFITTKPNSIIQTNGLMIPTKMKNHNLYTSENILIISESCEITNYYPTVIINSDKIIFIHFSRLPTNGECTTILQAMQNMQTYVLCPKNICTLGLGFNSNNHTVTDDNLYQFVLGQDNIKELKFIYFNNTWLISAI
jgi:hypothetical protein